MGSSEDPTVTLLPTGPTGWPLSTNAKLMNDPVERRALYAVIEREGLKKGIWAPIGSAFRNRDGSWNPKFDLLPMRPDTTIQMREATSEGATRDVDEE